MISTLIKLANNLDEGGHRKEANRLDSVINKLAEWGLGSLSAPEAPTEAPTETQPGGGQTGARTSTLDPVSNQMELVAQASTIGSDGFNNRTTLRDFAANAKPLVPLTSRSNVSGWMAGIFTVAGGFVGPAQTQDSAATQAGNQGRIIELSNLIAAAIAELTE